MIPRFSKVLGLAVVALFFSVQAHAISFTVNNVTITDTIQTASLGPLDDTTFSYGGAINSILGISPVAIGDVVDIVWGVTFTDGAEDGKSSYFLDLNTEDFSDWESGANVTILSPTAASATSGTWLATVGSLTLNQQGAAITPFSATERFLAGADDSYFLRFQATAAKNNAAVNFNVAAVPVPPAMLLFLSGLVGLVAIGRRRKTQVAA